MIKLGICVLGTLFLFNGLSVTANLSASAEQQQREEIVYRDSAVVTYEENARSAAAVEDITINYSTRSLDVHTLAYRFPAYTYSPAVGSCAAIAGGNVIGFYDRYDENLIPNHSSGRALGNTYIYSSEDSAVQAVIRELYDYMEITSGATEQQFLDGMTNFCKDKGHSITFSSCMQNKSLSYSKAKSYLDNNQPVILFLDGYNVVDMTEQENRDYLTVYLSEATHIMIGFGYKTYVYDGGAAYDYISVASGVTGYSSGLFNINYKTKINNALAVNIT